MFYKHHSSFAFQLFFLYFGLNLRHKWMPDIHCGKQTKLSKTIGVPIKHRKGEIISSQTVPLGLCYVYRLDLSGIRFLLRYLTIY